MEFYSCPETVIDFLGSFRINVVIQVLKWILPVYCPYGPEMLGEESVDSLLVRIVIFYVDEFFCFEENAKNPFAIIVKFIPRHDEHVAVIEKVLAKVNFIECA